jgi:hypothetical protein
MCLKCSNKCENNFRSDYSMFSVVKEINMNDYGG